MGWISVTVSVKINLSNGPFPHHCIAIYTINQIGPSRRGAFYGFTMLFFFFFFFFFFVQSQKSQHLVGDLSVSVTGNIHFIGVILDLRDIAQYTWTLRNTFRYCAILSTFISWGSILTSDIAQYTWTFNNIPRHCAILSK